MPGLLADGQVGLCERCDQTQVALEPGEPKGQAPGCLSSICEMATARAARTTPAPPRLQVGDNLLMLLAVPPKEACFFLKNKTEKSPPEISYFVTHFHRSKLPSVP